MKDCIFCKVASGQISSDFLHEDEHCVVFRDINPKMATHLLVVPKRHIDTIANLIESDVELMGHLIYTAKEVAKSLSLDGYKLLFNVGEGGGQEVFHIHMHLMSKFS